MRSVKDRVAALEVRAGAEANPVHSAAYERIFTALREALPIVPPTYRQVDCGTYYSVATDSPGVSFEELITSMHRRMQASALTDDDRRVLAALPIEDLRITDSSPEGLVCLYDRLFAGY